MMSYGKSNEAMGTGETAVLKERSCKEPMINKPTDVKRGLQMKTKNGLHRKKEEESNAKWSSISFCLHHIGLSNLIVMASRMCCVVQFSWDSALRNSFVKNQCSKLGSCNKLKVYCQKNSQITQLDSIPSYRCTKYSPVIRAGELTREGGESGDEDEEDEDDDTVDMLRVRPFWRVSPVTARWPGWTLPEPMLSPSRRESRLLEPVVWVK